jgi:hypothetical protein
MTVAEVLEWLATNSQSITAAAADREEGLARCGDALLRRARSEAAGTEPVIEMPVRSWCWRADRS